MSAKKSKKLQMPASIMEATKKLVANPLEAYACAAKAYRAANTSFRTQKYFTLALAYQGTRKLLEDPAKLKAFVEKAAPEKDPKALQPQEILRLSVERAEGAKTRSARKIAQKHARALSVLWKEKKDPDTIVEELRTRKIEKLAREAARTASGGSAGSGSGGDSGSGPDEIWFDVPVALKHLKKALKDRSRAKVTFYVKQAPDGEFEFSDPAVKRLKRRPIAKD